MTRVFRWSALLTALALGSPTLADEEWDKLKGEHEKAVAAWFEKLPEDEPDPDLSKLPPHPAAEFLPRLKAYAERHASDGDGLRALVFIVTQGHSPFAKSAEPELLWAVDTLSKHHAAAPDLVEHMPRLRHAYHVVGEKPMRAFYEAVIAQNAAPDAKAGAHVSLATMDWEGASVAHETQHDGSKHTALKKQAEQRFRTVAKEFPDTKAAKRAKSFLFEIEHLQVGMKAPEIVGRDEQEREVKLSQFAGQVVVLDFWGFW